MNCRGDHILVRQFTNITTTGITPAMILGMSWGRFVLRWESLKYTSDHSFVQTSSATWNRRVCAPQDMQRWPLHLCLSSVWPHPSEPGAEGTNGYQLLTLLPRLEPLVELPNKRWIRRGVRRSQRSWNVPMSVELVDLLRFCCCRSILHILLAWFFSPCFHGRVAAMQVSFRTVFPVLSSERSNCKSSAWRNEGSARQCQVFAWWAAFSLRWQSWSLIAVRTLPEEHGFKNRTSAKRGGESEMEIEREGLNRVRERDSEWVAGKLLKWQMYPDGKRRNSHVQMRGANTQAGKAILKFQATYPYPSSIHLWFCCCQWGAVHRAELWRIWVQPAAHGGSANAGKNLAMEHCWIFVSPVKPTVCQPNQELAKTGPGSWPAAIFDRHDDPSQTDGWLALKQLLLVQATLCVPSENFRPPPGGKAGDCAEAAAASDIPSAWRANSRNTVAFGAYRR